MCLRQGWLDLEDILQGNECFLIFPCLQVILALLQVDTLLFFSISEAHGIEEGESDQQQTGTKAQPGQEPVFAAAFVPAAVRRPFHDGISHVNTGIPGEQG
jgi:hypothetical protein